MTEKLDISRTVVRDAQQALAVMNLVAIRPGISGHVNQTPTNMVLNADVVPTLLA